jgi:hypothetical protein
MVNNMSAYLAMQILKGKLSYEQCVSKFPKYKEEIDAIIRDQGREDLIVEVN